SVLPHGAHGRDRREHGTCSPELHPRPRLQARRAIGPATAVASRLLLHRALVRSVARATVGLGPTVPSAVVATSGNAHGALKTVGGTCYERWLLRLNDLGL